MLKVNWENIATLKRPKDVVLEQWLPIGDTIRGLSHLQITASGRWTMWDAVLPCGPDGISGSLLPADQLLVADCPPGALIGKIGGSSASTSDSKPFAIGRQCVIAIPEHAVGPLFVGINGSVGHVTVTEELVVTLTGATVT